MGVVIRATGVARPNGRPWTHGARRLADEAIRQCLRQADVAGTEVDLLVNAGVYRERGLGEPALAALIQEDVEANARDLDGQGHGTFSFDIDNGGCGVLTAVDVVSGFLSSGAIGLGLVVASDSGPSPLHARAVPYPEAGGALLLGRDDDVAGFSAVTLQTYPEYADLLEGYWEWHDGRRPHRANHGSGGNRLVVVERPGFARSAVTCATETTRTALDSQALRPSDVDLLIATPEPGFADPLADGLGIPRERVLHLGEQLGAMHTAQPVFAIDAARRSGRWDASRTILMVSAGSGITVGCAVYRT